MSRQRLATPVPPRPAPPRPRVDPGPSVGGPVRAPRTAGPRSPGPRSPGANGTGVTHARSRGQNGLGPLTGLGVCLVLGAGCVGGGLLDLLLVGGPAWALVILYTAACGYTATRVRVADWYTALVGPPLAFALAIILLAMLMPSALGGGLLGTVATTFELLAGKAKALYLGTAISAGIVLVRRYQARRTAAAAA